jgi:inorganic pyrophosphatase
LPGQPNEVEISNIYGKEEAHEVIRKSMTDYNNTYTS